jgi:hypothetical protein
VRRIASAWTGLALALSGPASVRAEPTSGGSGDTVAVVAGSRYEAGWLHRLLFGDDYRDLWTMPVRVEVLDLDRYAGGLAPVRRVGAGQSSGLALRGADGRAYTFRGLEKDATRGLAPELRRTIAGTIAQDQTAALHPASAIVAAPLLEAAGVLHTVAHLVAMPDDQRLGEFRDFAGRFGTIQEYPRPAGSGEGFAGATEILGSLELLDRLHATPGERADSRAYLRARLMDLFLGDWDRHLGQWRWARIPGYATWQPIPEDRDFAFCRFDGLVLAVARNWYARWVTYGEEYPDIIGLAWQAWPLDREVLSDLDRSVWVEIAADLQRRLTDEVIEDAVARMPEEYRRVDGARLAKALRSRRDTLGKAAGKFYDLLADEVLIVGTDARDLAEVTAHRDGSLDVKVSREDGSGTAAWFERTFRRDETREIRLDLRDGDDVFASRGRSSVHVRVVGGRGDDVLDDSKGGGARLSDFQGENRLAPGPLTSVDERPYTAPPLVSETPYMPARDWGRETTYLPWFAAAPDIGVFIGAGVQSDRFAFRTYPYRSRQLLRAGYATLAGGFRADYEGELRLENSAHWFELSARASQIEILNFFGLGNDTDKPRNSSFFEVRQNRVWLAPRVVLPFGKSARLSLGPKFERAWSRRPSDSFVGQLRPYGSGAFGQIGVLADARVDTRDAANAVGGRALLLAAGASFHPALFDVESDFGEVHGEAVAVLGASLRFSPTLALRVGARRVFGTYPFHEAAFVGGYDTVRGFSQQRFAGDAAAYGSAELRFALGRYMLVLPGEYGVFALADTGRVWVDEEHSDAWHTGVGGGVWFAYLDRKNTVTIAGARSSEGTGFYFRAGFSF